METTITELTTTIDWSFWIPTLSIVVLIFLSAFFSGSETALTADRQRRGCTR